MKNLFPIICFIFVSTSSIAQNRDKDFCNETPDSSYFPLSIQKKRIQWNNTGYTEAKIKTKIIDGKEYIIYAQRWKNGDVGTLYLREEGGVVYQRISEIDNEFVRYDPSFKKGHKWNGEGYFAKFKVVSTNGKLKTPYCSYTKLLVIKGTYDSGESYKFYYLRGYGYVAATNRKGLVSFVIPL